MPGGGVGVGKCLEVGYVLAGFYFRGYPRFCFFQLLAYAAAAFCKFPAAMAAAEDTATGAQSAIPVRAGEACIDRKLVDLAAECFFAVVVECFIHGITPLIAIITLPSGDCNRLEFMVK